MARKYGSHWLGLWRTAFFSGELLLAIAALVGFGWLPLRSFAAASLFHPQRYYFFAPHFPVQNSEAQSDAQPDSQFLTPQSRGKLPITELTADEAVVHALNRLGYGPRPGDVERVKAMGLEKWIDQQLHPETIDDSNLQVRLDAMPVTKLSAQALLSSYPQPDAAAKRMGITVEEYRKRADQLVHPPQGVLPQPGILPQEVVNQMQQAKVLRAIYSERQLQQQLDDFWLNHFNVFVNKDLDLWLLEPYERDAISPHVLGKFRDLLEATAKNPAMLFYLDNYLSADPNAFDRIKREPEKYRARAGQQLPPLGSKRGLNENYGRELMELHTLGVDGGYNQKDVVEVARAFTGWTIRSPRQNPEFYFDERLHDPDDKRVLGKKIHAGGIKDGEQVLDLLAKNKHTAQRISLELARHFVSDTPPPSLVAHMAGVFEKSHGDLRAVTHSMIYSPEFWARTTVRAKVKKPMELVVSAARAMGTQVDDPAPLVGWIGRIGEPLYQCQPPTGYSDSAAVWVNTGALLNRLNYAISLASNRVRGSVVQLPVILGSDAVTDPYQAMDRAINAFLNGQISATTRATLDKESADPQVLGRRLPDHNREVNLGMIAGLVLGSPEFQQR